MALPKSPPIRTALEEILRLGFVFDRRSIWNNAMSRMDIGWRFDWDAEVAPGMPRPRHYVVRGHPGKFATIEEAAEALLEPRPGYYIPRNEMMRT